jgi:hypothetical protein
MISEFKSIFKDKSTCLIEINDNVLYIAEEKKFAKFVGKDDDFHFKVVNENSIKYHFIQNDDCVMKSFKGGQCDWIITHENTFIFIENKENLKIKSTSKNQNKAYKQLINTHIFYSSKLNFTNKNIKAVITLSKMKVSNTSHSTKRAEFKEKYNIDLLPIQNFIEL